MSLDRPENFFRVLHPAGNTAGQIILERQIKNSPKRSQVSPSQLENISSRVYGVPDICFSAASFSGLPLVLNFEKSTCLHLRIPEVGIETYTKILLHLGYKNISLPTLALSDGESLTLIWILEKPIEAHEFYRYSVLQNLLHDAAKEFSPYASGKIDLASTIQMVGSINSATGSNICIKHLHGKTHNVDHLERSMMQSFSASEYKRLQEQAGVSLELLSLFCDRWWSNGQHPEQFEDWIIYFGAALCHFCSTKQLKLELIAIAESLEGQPWSTISEKYDNLVTSIISTATEGFIEYGGLHISINHEHWTSLVNGRLAVTIEEIHQLGLYILGDISRVSPHIHPHPRHIYPIGSNDFIPLQRLLLKNAS